MNREKVELMINTQSTKLIFNTENLKQTHTTRESIKETTVETW